MSEKRFYWLKLSEDFFKSRDIKKLRKIAGGDTYTIIYLKLLLLSLTDNGYLYYEGVEPTFAEEMALAIDEDEENVEVTLSFLEQRGLLERKTLDEYLLTACAEMTGSETSAARRMRKTREKKALNEKTECNNVTLECKNETNCYTDVTNCYTEIDIDKEKDMRKTREKKALNEKTECNNVTLECKNETNCYTDVTNCYTEIDIDKEKDKEKEQDLDLETEKILKIYAKTKLPKLNFISDDLKAKIKNSLQQFKIEDFELCFKKTENSLFLTGKNNLGWKANNFISDDLKAKIKNSLQQFKIEDFELCFKKTENSLFLTGKNNLGWKANLEWFLKNDNMAKVLNGNYDNRPKNELENQPSYNLEKVKESKS